MCFFLWYTLGMNSIRRLICCVLLATLLFGVIPSARAEIYFNPHFIISDEEMSDYQSLTLPAIQRFLEDHESGLATLTTLDFEGKSRRASEIIYNAAVESRISPKVLLVTLQKEQSLITFTFPTQTQLDRAMGYRCPDGALCHPNALSFGKQVDGAAWQFRQYMDKPGNWNFRAGNTYDVDGFSITPLNTATAGLYNYTPHYSGNQHFWQIWEKFWGHDYPDGSLVKAKDNPGVWYIQYGTRRLVASWSVLLSRFDPKKILTLSRSDLEKYEVGPSIKFPNYSLLMLPDGKVYLLVNDELRHIASEEVFRTIGFNWEEVEEASEQDVAGYRYGDELTIKSVYPTGALVQDRDTGGVFFVENGIKHPILARELMAANYPGKVLTQASSKELDKYTTGEAVAFRDGELVRARDDNKIYVISNGYRRWITTETAFANLGYQWNNVIMTSQAVLTLHPLGEDIE